MRSRILRIPYVIDNESVRLADVLNDLLGAIPVPSLGGFSLANVSVGSSTEDGGTVVVAADLVSAPQ